MDVVLKGEDLKARGFSDSLDVASKRIPRSEAWTNQEIEIDVIENGKQYYLGKDSYLRHLVKWYFRKHLGSMSCCDVCCYHVPDMMSGLSRWQ